MLRRVGESFLGAGRRVGSFGSGVVDTFLRDNKVIPVVLALLALVVFAWIVAGAMLGGPQEEPVSNRAQVAQAEDPGASDPPAPEVDNPNVDSYAAYQFKDPFRQLVAPAETTTTTTPTTVPATTPATTPTPTTTPTTTPTDDPAGGDDGGGDPSLTGSDSDGDGLSDRREFDLGLDPANPDSDGDGTLDGQDDEASGRGDAGDAGEDGRGDGARSGDGGRATRDLPESGGRVPSP